MFTPYKVLCHKLGRKQNEWGDTVGLSGCAKYRTCPRLPISVQAEPGINKQETSGSQGSLSPISDSCTVPRASALHVNTDLLSSHVSPALEARDLHALGAAWRWRCSDLHQPRSVPCIHCSLRPATASILASPSLSF